MALKIYDNTRCDLWWNNDDDITSKMICAKNIGTLEGFCDGDSGGPLIVPKSSTDDTAVVIGVTSFAKSWLCDGEKPTVFADVTDYLDWIKPKMEN